VSAAELRASVRPPFPYRLPRRNGADGVLKVRGGVIHRLLHDPHGRPVVVRVAEVAPDVLFGARAADADAAVWAIDRMRFALGVDEHLGELHARFRWDPLIGPVLRADPGWRPIRRPLTFEAFAWAVTEQLIEFSRAAEIQRRLVWRWGRRHEALRDVPDASAVAARCPAELEACDLAGPRARALVSAAREIAAGRIDWSEPALRRLRAIPGIGPWTLAITALLGEGRRDACPAGDLHLRRLVGGGRGREAEAAEVLAYFSRYEEWAGYAALCALRSLGRRPRPVPARAGTRWSARPADRAAA
jgi:3-methyladenine DNA glycosylase/8-oxoguanine DNA glycosylase